ncbi:hypothetical protein [Streptomyces sp. NPDC054794]
MRAPLAVLLLAAGAAGCADTGVERSSDSSAARAVLRAVAKTEDAPSLRYRTTGRLPEDGRVRADGVVGTAPRVAAVKQSGLSGADRGEFEMRLVDRVLYQRMGKQQVHGRHWAGFGPRARFLSGSGLKMDTSAIRDQTGRNPAREAAFLAAADDVRRVGGEKVAGTATTHYAGTATLDAVSAWLKDRGDAPGRGQTTLKMYQGMGVDELTIDVWVGSDGRVKQHRTRGFGRHGELDLTVVLRDFGKPVSVQAPPAGDTVDLSRPARKGRG